MSETYQEQLDRVKQMASGNPTWGLSDNDIAPLNLVIGRLESLEKEALQSTAGLGLVLEHLGGSVTVPFKTVELFCHGKPPQHVMRDVGADREVKYYLAACDHPSAQTGKSRAGT
jgi:hypothetical protein